MTSRAWSRAGRAVWPPRLPPASTIQTSFGARRNAVGALRLFFAVLVVIDHSFPIAGHGVDPLLHFSRGQESFGGVSVAGFFLLSGFLITRSAEHTSLPRYLWHRILRIFPAFLVCLLTTAFGFAAILWIHEKGSLHGFFNAVPLESPGRYVRVNAKLTIQQYNIDGLLASTPYAHSGYPQALDGSLYTLIYEFKCYLAIGALAYAGVLRRSRALVPVLAGTVYVVVTLQAAHVAAIGPLVPEIGLDQNFARFSLYFLIGSCAYLYADRVPMDDRLGLCASFLTIITLRTGGFLLVGTISLAYVVLWLGIRLPFQRLGTNHDLSYGIYIYGFPVQQLLADYRLERFGIIAFTTISIAGAGALATVSWHLVERPSLRLRQWTPLSLRSSKAREEP